MSCDSTFLAGSPLWPLCPYSRTSCVITASSSSCTRAASAKKQPAAATAEGQSPPAVPAGSAGSVSNIRSRRPDIRRGSIVNCGSRTVLAGECGLSHRDTRRCYLLKAMVTSTRPGPIGMRWSVQLSSALPLSLAPSMCTEMCRPPSPTIDARSDAVTKP